MVTKGYLGFQGLKRLLEEDKSLRTVTSGYKVLLGVRGSYKSLQRLTERYKGL